MVYVRDLMTLFIYSKHSWSFHFLINWILHCIFLKRYIYVLKTQKFEKILKCYIVFKFEGHVLGTLNCYIQNTPFSIDRTCYDFVNGCLSGKERPSIKDMCNCGGGGMNARVSCTGLSEVIPQPKLLFHHSIYFSYNTTICPR